MGRKVLTYSTVLIGMYLVGAKASNWGRLLKDTSTAGAKIVKTFQARA